MKVLIKAIISKYHMRQCDGVKYRASHILDYLLAEALTPKYALNTQKNIFCTFIIHFSNDYFFHFLICPLDLNLELLLIKYDMGHPV